MKQIWKYEMTAFDDHFIEMPIGAKFLSIQTQDGKPVMWFLVNPAISKEFRRFRVVGTGHELNLHSSDEYLGTFQIGAFVGHLFKLI